MLSKIERALRKARYTISTNQWLVRCLGLSVDRHEAGGSDLRKGLLIIQIDGLSKPQLKRALENNSMPFLKRLLERDGYQLESLYSGLPSSTPAVQGELFYGVKGCVPAFSFKRHEDQKTVVMVERDTAARVEARLSAKGGSPLLMGGSSYSNLYRGGASETSFCASSTGWSNLMPTNHLVKMVFFALLKTPNIVRAATLAVVEAGVAVVDMARGLIDGKNFMQELKFIPMRIAASAVLREMVETGVSLDVTRGLPIVHANFIGYDEQAHRRGPSSKFAHWSLRGIDRALNRIWNTAKRCPYRDYDIWFYSDHGQESVVPFPLKSGVSIQQCVCQYFSEIQTGLDSQHTTVDSVDTVDPVDTDRPLVTQRGHWLGWRFLKLNKPIFKHSRTPEVVAMGPVGFVYLPDNTSADVRDKLALRLSEQQHGLLVCVPDRAARHDSRARLTVLQDGKEYQLPDDAKAIFGADHPFFQDVVNDFIDLVNHVDAGEIVITGWSRATQMHMSLRIENGSHAGPGENETHAFALLPGDTEIGHGPKSYIRPMDLRRSALKLLGRGSDSMHTAAEPEPALEVAVTTNKSVRALPLGKRAEHTHCLRVLTYNVHSCIGMDGQLSTTRIARVISNYQPDVVCLQEVDVDCAKTHQVDQVKLIAAELSMEVNFHPIRHVEKGRFGNAILTDLPMQRVKSELLYEPKKTRLPRKPFNEARGALWVKITHAGKVVNVITTHLGLTIREREFQVDELLSSRWLEHPDCQGPTILCGDFNAVNKSNVIKRVSARLHKLSDNRGIVTTAKTFPSSLPVARLDHVFLGGGCRAVNTAVGDTFLAKVASDHLPVIADIELV